MTKISLLLACSTLLLFSCGKTEPGTTLPTPVDTTITVPPVTITDSAKYILLSKKEPVAFPGTITLTCYNNDYTVKWEKKQLGTTSTYDNGLDFSHVTPGALYNNGVVYYSCDSAFSVSGNYYRYNHLYAFDINTGNEIWHKKSLTENIENPIIRNDTIFCNLKINNQNNIALFSATTGELIWKQPIEGKFGADNLLLDGGTLYYVATLASFTSIVYSFSLSSKSIDWEVPIGVNLNSYYSAFILSGNKLFIKTGTGTLISFNKSNGNILWQKTSNFGTPFLANNIVYTFDFNEIKLLGFSFNDGSAQFSLAKNMTQWPFISGSAIYFCYENDAQQNILASANAATGVTNWQVNVPTTIRNFIVSGYKLYAMQQSEDFRALGDFDFTMKVFDKNSGALRQSIVNNALQIGKIGIINFSGELSYPHL